MAEKSTKKRPVKAKANDVNFWELKLYIAGKTPRSSTAIRNLNRICEEHLKGKYRITVVDLSENPEVALREQIVVTPTLIRELPPPLRKLIGDLSKEEKVLVGLDIIPQ